MALLHNLSYMSTEDDAFRLKCVDELLLSIPFIYLLLFAISLQYSRWMEPYIQATE
jgi:hypothetical protein